ncbi:uncharacterized protein LOC108732588 isoform X2 [Agrilus planipennis]|uniref:Uncharacterized protein LOC108732588 isoform X2 n=1 Tax=Agrilus planipennis TaxID=224129 RepID=A0A1W4WG36_AGRPL|nr:uncharacterized protein LOC108732588 isoform X2 [Agrilus planipennis]
MVILQLEEQPPLVQAIIAGELENVKTILENKHDVNCLDIEKRSPLHAAAFIGDPNITELLLQHGARVNCKDNKWLTPLHRACCTGSGATVYVLLRYQADVTARDRQWQTPLHIAAANNAYKCVVQLLEVVPNINVTDRSGRTALHHAAMNGHNDIVDLLISKGCIINACDKKDCRPIHLAAYMGHVDTLELLIRHGADINAKDRNQYTALHVAAASGMFNACRLLLNHGAFTECRNAYGNTPLHIACMNGHLQVCQELVAFNADPDATNYKGQAPLHIAAASTHGVECLNYLLELKVNINRQSLDGRTPLHMTALHGRFTRSKTLIDKGAVVDTTDKNGCTALHIAAQYGHDLLANTLLSHGADPNKKGYEGMTPLHMCCLSGFVECCRKFLQAGVDINAQDDTGKTATHCAAYKGSVECLDLLVSNGAKFQLVDKKGRTPLHYAAVQGRYPCVFTLVGLGSSVNLKDEEGCSALHFAAVYNQEEKCVKYLIEHKADPKMKDNNGFTPIHYAVAGNNYKAVEYLLSAVGSNFIMHGADMPLTTPLHLAAVSGSLDILSMLLPYFHDTNVRTEHGSTPLLIAAREGYTHCVQMLLRFGSKVAICDNIYSMNPVHYSAKNGHMHCLALLLDNTEDKSVINMSDSLQRTPLMLAVLGGHTDCALNLLKSGADPNIVDGDNRSSLFRAVVNSQNNAVQLLISKGADLKQVDVNGKTVFHLAAACGNLPCLKTVVCYTDPNVLTLLDKQDCSALHWACYNGHADCVDFLLGKKIFENMKGNPFSPVHCAAFSGSEKCIELLCNCYGTESVLLKDARNRTPLHIAALHGHTECAKYLLEKGAEINYQDAEGRTPLIAAAQNGQTHVIDVLISYKADVTLYDNNGNTALHLACLKKHSHAALLLLEHINDQDVINMINNDRKTALHLSARNGLVEVTRQLIDKGASVLVVDSSGMTPALCCAPNSNVAQCLAVILASYPKQQLQQQKVTNHNSIGDKANIFSELATDPSPSEDSYLIRHVIEIKRSSIKTRDNASQTKMSLLQNPDYFHCQILRAEARAETRTNSASYDFKCFYGNRRPRTRISGVKKAPPENEKQKSLKRKLLEEESMIRNTRYDNVPSIFDQRVNDNEDPNCCQTTNVINLHRSRSHMSVNRGVRSRHPKRAPERPQSTVSLNKPEHLKRLLTDLNLGENKPDSFYETLSEKLSRSGTAIDKCLKHVLLKHLADRWARDTSDNFTSKYVNRKTSDETLDKIMHLRSKIAALKTTNEMVEKFSNQNELMNKIHNKFGIKASELSLNTEDCTTNNAKELELYVNEELKQEDVRSEEELSTLVIKYHPFGEGPSMEQKVEEEPEYKLLEICEKSIEPTKTDEIKSCSSLTRNDNDTVIVPRKFLEMLIKSDESHNVVSFPFKQHISEITSNESLEDFSKSVSSIDFRLPSSSYDSLEDVVSHGNAYLKVLESFSNDEILRVDDVYKMEANDDATRPRKNITPRLPFKGKRPTDVSKLEAPSESHQETMYKNSIKNSLTDLRDTDCLKSLAHYVELLVTTCNSRLTASDLPESMNLFSGVTTAKTDTKTKPITLTRSTFSPVEIKSTRLSNEHYLNSERIEESGNNSSVVGSFLSLNTSSQVLQKENAVKVVYAKQRKKKHSNKHKSPQKEIGSSWFEKTIHNSDVINSASIISNHTLTNELAESYQTIQSFQSCQNNELNKEDEDFKSVQESSTNSNIESIVENEDICFDYKESKKTNIEVNEKITEEKEENVHQEEKTEIELSSCKANLIHTSTESSLICNDVPEDSNKAQMNSDESPKVTSFENKIILSLSSDECIGGKTVSKIDSKHFKKRFSPKLDSKASRNRSLCIRERAKFYRAERMANKLQKLKAKKLLASKTYKGKATKKELRKRWPKNREIQKETGHKKDEDNKNKLFKEYLLRQAQDIGQEDLKAASTSKAVTEKYVLLKENTEAAVGKKLKQKSNCVIS